MEARFVFVLAIFGLGHFSPAESPLDRAVREQRRSDLRNEGLEINRRAATQEQLDRIEAARQVAQPTPLDHLEAAFYGGTMTAAVAARRVSSIPEAGGWDFIRREGFNPTKFTASKARDAYSNVIDAIAFDDRLHALADAINAEIEAQGVSKRVASPPPVAQSTAPAAAESGVTPSETDTQAAQRDAVRLYPELGQTGSALNRRFLDIVKQARANEPSIFHQTDWPLVLARRLGNDTGMTAAPVDVAREAAFQENKRNTRRLYPQLKEENSPLSREWLKVYAEMEKENDPLIVNDDPSIPLIIANRAAKNLGIVPVAE